MPNSSFTFFCSTAVQQKPTKPFSWTKKQCCLVLKFYSFARQISSFQELFVAFDTLENFFAIKDWRNFLHLRMAARRRLMKELQDVRKTGPKYFRDVQVKLDSFLSRDLNTEHIRYSKGGPQPSQSGLYYLVYILDICIYY